MPKANSKNSLVSSASVQLPPQMWRALEAAAFRKRISQAAFLRALLAKQLPWLRHSTDSTVRAVPTYSTSKPMRFPPTDFAALKETAHLLAISWYELVFECVARWYENRGNADLREPVPEPEILTRRPTTADPAIIAFYDHWQRQRDGKTLPAFRDMLGKGVQPFEPGLLVVEIQSNDPPFFIYRKAGVLEQRSRGFDPTGYSVSAAYIGASKQTVLNTYNTVVSQRKAIMLPPFHGDDVLLRDRGSIFVPVSEEGGRVTHIVAYSAFQVDE